MEISDVAHSKLDNAVEGESHTHKNWIRACVEERIVQNNPDFCSGGTRKKKGKGE